MQAFVSKARRPEFELHLRIIDLNNVPLVSGTSFIKWNLPSSTAAEHRGRTPKSSIKDHKVVYDYDKVIPVRLLIGKDQILQETLIHFEIVQEYSSGGRGERITLGVLDLNLAEYVEDTALSPSDEPSGLVSRRYLMQQSKINSTLKIDVEMTQVKGEKNFIVPPLRTAPVFGGIAGIMSYEADAADDTNHLQSPQGRSRETGERQDLYRLILAASWAAAPGQLKADECIEDIFAGGDGWGAEARKTRKSRYDAFKGGFGSGGDSRRDKGNADERTERNFSGFFKSADRIASSRQGGKQKYRSGSPTGGSTVSGRGGLDDQAGKIGLTASKLEKQQNEVDEFDASRDDLRSWKISAAAMAR